MSTVLGFTEASQAGCGWDVFGPEAVAMDNPDRLLPGDVWRALEATLDAKGGCAVFEAVAEMVIMADLYRPNVQDRPTWQLKDDEPVAYQDVRGTGSLRGIFRLMRRGAVTEVRIFLRRKKTRQRRVVRPASRRT
jgi:hypothetical protein